jgi:hypothetical protein
VAGVVALVVSRFGDADNPQNGKMRPGAVQQYVEKTADPQPCPTAAQMTFYAPFTRPGGKAVAHDTSNR